MKRSELKSEIRKIIEEGKMLEKPSMFVEEGWITNLIGGGARLLLKGVQKVLNSETLKKLVDDTLNATAKERPAQLNKIKNNLNTPEKEQTFYQTGLESAFNDLAKASKSARDFVKKVGPEKLVGKFPVALIASDIANITITLNTFVKSTTEILKAEEEAAKAQAAAAPAEGTAPTDSKEINNIASKIESAAGGSVK